MCGKERNSETTIIRTVDIEVITKKKKKKNEIKENIY